MTHRAPRSGRPCLRPAFIAALAIAACAIGAGGLPRASAQEPDEAFLDRVIASMSVDERVGQLVMVNFIGDDVSPESDIAGLVRDFKVGAVLVSASNGNIINRGDTPRQIAALTNGLQQRAFEGTAKVDDDGEYFLPLFVAVDHEGDLFPFTHVTNGYTAIPNNMTIGATWSKDHARRTGEIVGSELSAAGINMLLGPVVDVLDNPRSGGRGDIGIRSFGGSPAWVGMLGRSFVRGVHDGSEGRMVAVAKHFPGHGGSDRSTDNEVPTVNKSLQQLRASELAPFAELVRDDGDTNVVDAMMVSHIRYRNFLAGGSGSTRPISIDAPAFRGLMELPEFVEWRERHMVIADSLGVPAIKEWFAREEGASEFPNRTVVRQALLAGNDLLPLVEFYRDPAQRGWAEYQLPVIQDSIIYMREQYVADQEFRRRADDALRRVLRAKLGLYPALSLDDVLVDADDAAAKAGQGRDDMRALAEAALTLIQPVTVDELRSRMPRGPVAPDRVLIVECWADCYPYRVTPQLDLQNHMLSMYGPAGSGRIAASDVRTISFGDLDAWLSNLDDPAHEATAAAVRNATWIVFALAEYNPTGYPASAAVRRFLDDTPVDVRNKYLVAFAFNSPYHLDSTEISKLNAYFALYSKTEVTLQTAVRALFGDVTPRGKSPVSISGMFYSVAEATQPDPAQTLQVAVFGQEPDDVPNEPSIGLVAGPILDRNGNVVPDGTLVSFTLAKSGGATTTASARTVDGLAGGELETQGAGDYFATASVAGITSQPLELTIRGAAVPEPTSAEPEPDPIGDASSSNTLAIVVAASVTSAAALAVAGAGATWYVRRRRAHGPATDSAALAAPEPIAPAPPAGPPAVRVETDTRRVYIKGVEARPPLSNEQFRLLSYLHDRAGKVVSRDELVAHVWPDAHADGVSEEALDALVRRVRERIVQAGGERSYIVTLRGQGFRLET